MDKVLFLVLLFSIAISCNQKTDTQSVKTSVYNSKSSNTIISGVISNAATNFVVLKKDEYTDTTYLDDQRGFTIKLHLPNPEYFIFSDGKSNFKIFLSPGDNLNVSFNSKNIFSTVQYSGVGSEPNIYFKEKYLLMLDHAIPMVHLYEKPVHEFRHLVDSFYVINNMYFNEFLNNNETISPYFKDQELASLAYDRAAQLMEYLNTNSYGQEINESRYLKFLEPLSVNESGLLEVYEYKLFLNAYITYFAGKRTKSSNASSVDITLAKMQTVSAEIQNQDVKDYLLYTFLKEHVKYYGYKNTDVLFKIVEFQCKNDQMKEGILAPYYEYVKLSVKQKAPKIRMVDKDGNKYTLDNFEGQYVYIDVWASWCLPCRKEAPLFKELKEKYNSKNIAFVSISIDAKKDAWMDFLKLKDSYENQFLVDEIQPFLDAFMIKTIPHFLIIDNEGNLIDNNASRPSEYKTEWIEELPDKVEV